MVKNDASPIQKVIVIIKDITQETRNSALVMRRKIAPSTKNEIAKKKIEHKPAKINMIRNINTDIVI